MNLIKWFRKNNTKVMAVVVIILMVAFVGGSSLSYLLQPDRTGVKRTIATFAEKTKIKGYDLKLANQELEILRTLRADDMLKMLQVPLLNTSDLQAFFLSELLFSEQRTSPAYINYIKRTIGTNLYSISEKQLNDMYRRPLRDDEIYWHCLKSEAQLAGIRVPPEEAGELLGQVIPQLFNGGTYSQVIGSIVSRQGITQEQILETFGLLLSVLRYADLMCSGQDMTTRQLMQTTAWEHENVDVEFVEFNSSAFTETQEEPGEGEMLEHFEKYKGHFSGDVNDENPYGLGYKLPERIQLEYIIVKLNEISPIINPPTQDEVDEYYDRFKEQLFTEQVPSDPNDPNSQLVDRVKSPSSVVDIISEQLRQDKINSKAESIIQEAITITEAPVQDINEMELENLSSEELAKIVGDYQTSAGQLSEKHKIKVYAGKTGLLSAMDMQTDELLSRLYLLGYGQNPVSLVKAVFAVDELAVSELGPYDVQKPRMHINIGPVRDIRNLQGGSGEIIAVMRVTQAIKAAEPESINETFSTRLPVLDPNEKEASEDIYSVKEQVVENLKKLAALETAESKAREFIELAANEDWQDTVTKFNELYGQNKPQDPNDPNTSEETETETALQETFKLENLTGLKRISKATLKTIATQSDGSPVALYVTNERKRSSLLVQQLYSLVPADSNSVEGLPMVMEFKPDMSFYCIKNLSIQRLWKEEYDKFKAIRLHSEDTFQSQSLAARHFNPENILKRMNFKLIETEESTEPNTPAVSEGAS